jgi:hypothetical protein
MTFRSGQAVKPAFETLLRRAVALHGLECPVANRPKLLSRQDLLFWKAFLFGVVT